MIRRASLVIALLTPFSLLPLGAADPVVTFEGDIKPIFKKHCLACHNAERPRGDLDLTSYTAVMTGGLGGKSVVAKMPESSPLYTMTAHLEDPKMPPNKPKIPQRELDAIKAWIDGGLVEKTQTVSTVPAVSSESGLIAVKPLNRKTPLVALATSPTNPIAAVPGQRQVLLYDTAEKKMLGALAFPEGEVHALRFSTDGKTLVAAGGIGGQSGTAVGFDTTTWKRSFTVTDDAEAILAVDLAPDRTKLIIGGPGRVGKVVSLPDGKLLHAFRKPTDWVLSAGFSPDGLLCAIGDRFGGLFVYETKSGKDFLTLRGHGKGVTAIAWPADGESLVSASDDGTVRTWDLHTGEERVKWTAHEAGVLDVAMTQNATMATAGRDGVVSLSEKFGDKSMNLAQLPDTAIKVAFTHDKKALLATDWRGELSLIDLVSKKTTALPLPLKPVSTQTAMVAVPNPTPEPKTIAKVEPKPAAAPAVVVTNEDVNRKRLALKAVDEALEKVKDEAARDPKNAALTKAYLQLCETSLALKAEVLAAEAAAKPASPR
ncbi:MAG: c-type cytochrome domain-containing protein [Fimbriiglobus sp.]